MTPLRGLRLSLLERFQVGAARVELSWRGAASSGYKGLHQDLFRALPGGEAKNSNMVAGCNSQNRLVVVVECSESTLCRSERIVMLTLLIMEDTHLRRLDDFENTT